MIEGLGIGDWEKAGGRGQGDKGQIHITHPPFPITHSPLPITHSPLPIPHYPFPMPHALFPMPLLMPLPGVEDNIFDAWILWLPAEDFAGFFATAD